jgi:predicted SnoaL-like aldol condensation-catalyzing enzyme
MPVPAESAKAYVARVMASYKNSLRVEIDDVVASVEDGSAMKVTGRAFYSDGSETAFEWDVWRLEDGELYGEW